MRDIDIRIALRSTDLERFLKDGESRVVEELGIFRGNYRIDVAVVNGALHGYEIKSARDTLARLPAQAEAYSAVFNFVTLVTSASHLDRAGALVPAWWGIQVAESTGRRVILTEVRSPQVNPSVDPYRVAQLLWMDEAVALLDRHGGARGFRGKRMVVLWRELAQRIPAPDLQTEVRNILKARPAWRDVSQSD
jgi:hypothetical protein